jgi:hypothetical protein
MYEASPTAPPASTNQAELILNRNTAIALKIAKIIVNQSTRAARPNVYVTPAINPKEAAFTPSRNPLAQFD